MSVKACAISSSIASFAEIAPLPLGPWYSNVTILGFQSFLIDSIFSQIVFRRRKHAAKHLRLGKEMSLQFLKNRFIPESFGNLNDKHESIILILSPSHGLEIVILPRYGHLSMGVTGQGGE